MKKTLLAFLLIGFCVADAAGVAVDLNEPKHIKADKIEYNLKTKTIKTVGNTEITNKSGQKITLQDSYISKDGKNLSGGDIQLWLGNHVYLESKKAERNGNITTAYNAEFTACKDCDSYGEAWDITAKRAKHDLESRMLYFYNMAFWAYDIPIFWSPYFSMPDPGVKYKSGLLAPSMESTNNMGTQINLPIYVNFSNTHDATVTLSYLTKENPLAQLNHRLNLSHSEFRTNASFTHNREGDNRWHLFNYDIIELGNNARSTIFLERVSDKTYLQKYGFYDEQPYLDSGAKVELFGQSSYVVADAHIFQELRNAWGIYAAPDGDILPNIRGVYQTAPFFAETYATFMGDTLSVYADDVYSQRLIGEARVISPWTIWGGNRITASLATRYDIYNFHNETMVDRTIYSGVKTRFLPSGYLEWGLPFIRPGEKWIQTIEPRARLTLMRHIQDSQFALNNDSAGALLSDTTIFSNNRFSGLDLWENGTFADYGVRWSAFNKDRRSVEIFLGQTYDFTKRENTDLNSGFHNGQSDYVGRVAFNNMKWLDIYSRFRLSRHSLGLRHMETNMVLGTSKNFVNVGHFWSQQFTDLQSQAEYTHEIAGGVGFALTKRWSIRWNTTYNVTFDKFQRHGGTIFYEHPCYYFSIGYRRDNAIKGDYVGNTTFQFRFGLSVEGKHY